MISVVAIFFLLPFAFCQFTTIKSFEAVFEGVTWMALQIVGGKQWQCHFTYNGVATKVDYREYDLGYEQQYACTPTNCLTNTNPNSTVLSFSMIKPDTDLRGSCELNLSRYETFDGATKYQRMLLMGRGAHSEDSGYFAFRVKSELIACASRPKDSTNCSSVNDSTGCYAQPDGTGCKTTCPTHYDKGEGVCVRQSCRERQINSTATSVCGEECYGHVDGKSCVERCPTTHYMVATNKQCKIKDCLSRIVDDGARNPCGEGACYKQPSGDQCNISCPDKYVVGAKGTCTLGDCATRLIDENSKFPCGDGRCYKQPYNLGCAKDCPALHYETGKEGVCVLKPCRSRQADQDAKYTCGDPNCTELPSGKCW